MTNVLVRKRVCSMIAKFFENLNADAVLDVKLCDIVINIMKERIKVRPQGVHKFHFPQVFSSKCLLFRTG